MNNKDLDMVCKELINLKRNLSDNKQIDSYGDVVLHFKSTIKNINEFETEIKKHFASIEDVAGVLKE